MPSSHLTALFTIKTYQDLMVELFLVHPCSECGFIAASIFSARRDFQKLWEAMIFHQALDAAMSGQSQSQSVFESEHFDVRFCQGERMRPIFPQKRVQKADQLRLDLGSTCVFFCIPFYHCLSSIALLSVAPRTTLVVDTRGDLIMLLHHVA